MSSQLNDDLEPSERARFDEVCRFGQDNREAIALTVARAFADDPIWMWIYDSASTIDIETGIVLGRMQVAESSPADQMHGFRHFGAVALWSAPVGSASAEIEEATGARVKPFRDEFIGQIGERAKLTGKLREALTAHKPEEPHWYLGTLATDPDRQNEGLGGRVITTMQDRCDRLGVPTYLVSSNPRNYGFYQRHGYRELELFDAGGSPPLLGFWRDPR